MALLPGDAGSQPVRFQPRPAPAAPPPSQWRGFPSAAAPVRSAGAPPTHTDASMGGGNYGAPQVNAFKQSPSYRQAIIDTFLHQPAPQARAIVRGALRIPSLEGHAVLNYISSHGLDPRSIASGGNLGMSDKSVLNVGGALTDLGHVLGPHSSATGQLGWGAAQSRAGSQAVDAGGKVLDTGLKGASDALRAVQPQGVGPAGRLSNEGFGGGTIGQVAVHAPIDIARAAVQDPIGVGAKTLKGLGDVAAGLVAAPMTLATQPSKIGKIPGQFAADLTRRYGDVAAGHDQAFIDRIKKEGAAPELVDALAFTAGLDATGGRALSQLAHTKATLTGRENFLTRPRPNLLISGTKFRPQELAGTAGRATAQRLEDKLRAAKKPGELVPGAGQVAPLFERHAMRVVHSAISQGARRVSQEVLNKEVRKGSDAQVAHLNPWQKLAVSHAVEGVRVDTAANFRADLAARRASIVQDRLNPASLGYGGRIPAQFADQVDELKLIDRLSANAEKIVGPKMVRFQSGEAARAQRIEKMTALNPVTAEARRLRPHGDRLGIQHPDEAAAQASAAVSGGTPEQLRTLAAQMEAKAAKQEASKQFEFGLGNATRLRQQAADLREQAARPSSLATALRQGRAEGNGAKFADYQANRTAHLAEYVKRVRAGMKPSAKYPHGLPEPGYLKHQEHPKANLGDFTTGGGGKAMPADRQSSWALYRAGVLDRSPTAYSNGLARSIKRPFQHSLVDEQLRAAHYPTPTRDQIKAALGRAKPANDLTGHELRRVLANIGYKMDEVQLYNPGRLAESTIRGSDATPVGHTLTDNHEELINKELHGQLSQHEVVQPGKASEGENPRYLQTTGWKAVPKTAFDEIHGGLKGSSAPGRLWGKVMGAQAGLALYANPHFVVANTLAHAIPALFGTKGAVLDFAKAPLWWHGLSEAERNQVRRFEAGRVSGHAHTARLGSTAPNAIAGMGRRLDQNGLARVAKNVNPFALLNKAEDLQSQGFRHAVMYHEIKHQAFLDMGKEYGNAVRAWEQIKGIFNLGPQQRMQAIIDHMPTMEKLGRHTINMMGDYGRFTNRERALFNNRLFLFYSFMRHVTRTLFYVLPARHPLALGLMGELSGLHKNEVQQLMGGQDLPWAYGRVFFGGKNGQKLSSIDTLSMSPVTSGVTSVAAGGMKEAAGLMSPVMTTIMNQVYGHTPQGAPYQQNFWSAANDALSLSYLYRQAKAAHQGLAPQQSDSIPWLHDRPQVAKSSAGQAYNLAKQQARGPLSQYMLGSALPLYPKPDDSQVIAAHQAARAAAKGGRSSGLSGSALSGAGGSVLDRLGIGSGSALP